MLLFFQFSKYLLCFETTFPQIWNSRLKSTNKLFVFDFLSGKYVVLCTFNCTPHLSSPGVTKFPRQSREHMSQITWKHVKVSQDSRQRAAAYIPNESRVLSAFGRRRRYIMHIYVYIESTTYINPLPSCICICRRYTLIRLSGWRIGAIYHACMNIIYFFSALRWHYISFRFIHVLHLNLIIVYRCVQIHWYTYISIYGRKKVVILNERYFYGRKCQSIEVESESRLTVYHVLVIYTKWVFFFFLDWFESQKTVVKKLARKLMEQGTSLTTKIRMSVLRVGYARKCIFIYGRKDRIRSSY